MQARPARSRRRWTTSCDARPRERPRAAPRAPPRRLAPRAGGFLRRGGSRRCGAPKIRSASIRPTTSTPGPPPLPCLKVGSRQLESRDLASTLESMMETATASARVLVVEDDEAIADVLRRSLRAEGHEVRSAGDGAEALTAAEQFSPDLVVLDLGLPRLDGMEVCRRLRAESDVPILILTARTETEDRVKGLDTGPDDYLPKPFERSELLARIRALLRRRPPRGSASIVVGDLLVNPDTREVKRAGREIELTNREFELLEYLARNQRLVVSRERLLEDVWGYDPFEQTNTIDVFISNLRRKLESGGEPRLLHTKRGAGYVLKGAA